MRFSRQVSRGAYDRVQTLIVDPFLAFSTYIGVLDKDAWTKCEYMER